MVVCMPKSSDSYNDSSSSPGNGTVDRGREETIEVHLRHYVLPAICLFGIIGNLLNLLVLTRRSLQNRMGNLERSANFGLCSMAVSDLLLCCLLLPQTWVDHKQFSFEQYSFELFYIQYHNTFVNIFILTGTLLIVYMALQRYVGILQPLQARIIVRTRTSVIILSGILFFGIFLNIPKFFYRTLSQMECIGNFSVYYLDDGFMKNHRNLSAAYEWIFSFIGIFAPLLILLYCNVHLIRALHSSTKMRCQFRNDNRKEREAMRRVTLTLIIIVICYIMLVVPTEIIKLLKDIGTQTGKTPAYNLLVAIANIGQGINFAFNFILYCFVNPNFRNTLKMLLLPSCLQKPNAASEETGETVKLTSIQFTNPTKCDLKEEKIALKTCVKDTQFDG